jgi:hypothetical protein
LCAWPQVVIVAACRESRTFLGRIGSSSTALTVASPIDLAANYGFSDRELNIIRSYIDEHLPRLREAWDEHCGS